MNLGFLDPTIIIPVAILILVVVLAARGFKIIPQAETMVIERLGRYHRTLSSGINIIWPIIDRPRLIHWRIKQANAQGIMVTSLKTTNRIDLREAVYDFARQTVITKDNVTIEIDALLYFQVVDPVRSIYEIANLPLAIEKLTTTTLRNVIGEMDLDGALVSRDTINQKLRSILDEATDKWGVKVTRVELQDITPPKDIQTAMEKQMRAERDRRAAILEAEGLKQAAILKSQGGKEAEINQAEGLKQAAILEAEGQAEARIRVAEAEAEAVRQVTGVIQAVNGDPVNYLIAIRYIEALKEMATGQDSKTVYMPFEATGLLGAVGGIKDMLKVGG